MVISKEQGHAQHGNINCATNNAVKITANNSASNGSIADAQKACMDALKEVMANPQFAR